MLGCQTTVVRTRGVFMHESHHFITFQNNQPPLLCHAYPDQIVASVGHKQVSTA